MYIVLVAQNSDENALRIIFIGEYSSFFITLDPVTQNTKEQNHTKTFIFRPQNIWPYTHCTAYNRNAIIDRLLHSFGPCHIFFTYLMTTNWPIQKHYIRHSTFSRIFYCDAIFGSSWPWSLYWLWSDDAQPRSTDRFAVLRCFTSAAHRTSPSTNFSVPVAHWCTRSFSIGLL